MDHTSIGDAHAAVDAADAGVEPSVVGVPHCSQSSATARVRRSSCALSAFSALSLAVLAKWGVNITAPLCQFATLDS